MVVNSDDGEFDVEVDWSPEILARNVASIDPPPSHFHGCVYEK